MCKFEIYVTVRDIDFAYVIYTSEVNLNSFAPDEINALKWP